MTEESKMAFLAELLRNGGVGQLFMDNHGEVSYNKNVYAGTKAEEDLLAKHERMLSIIKKSYEAGLWWASTAWCVVYRLYCKATNYSGNFTAFEREVKGWNLGIEKEFECKADNFTKPLRKNPLLGSADDWERQGVDARMVALGRYIEDRM